MKKPEKMAIDSEERQLIKETFRRMHARANTPNEDVMSRFYGIEHNNNKPVLLDKTLSDRLVKKYGACDKICVSAYSEELSQEVNDANTRDLLKEIKDSGLAYLPLYHKGIGDDYLPFFIVFYDEAKGKPTAFDKYDVGYSDDEKPKNVNPMPCQLTERMRRKNEIMIWE